MFQGPTTLSDASPGIRWLTVSHKDNEDVLVYSTRYIYTAYRLVDMHAVMLRLCHPTYMYVRISTSKHTHVCAYMYIHVHTCAYMYIHVHKCTYIRTYSITCTCVRTYMLHMYVNTWPVPCTHVCIYSTTHTHIRTYTCILSSLLVSWANQLLPTA